MLKPALPLGLYRVVFGHLVRGQQSKKLLGVLCLLNGQVRLGCDNRGRLGLHSCGIGSSGGDYRLQLVLCSQHVYQELSISLAARLEQGLGFSFLLAGKVKRLCQASELMLPEMPAEMSLLPLYLPLYRSGCRNIGKCQLTS